MIASDETTLRGYEEAHGRPPAFEGSDGRAYSAGIFSEDDPGPDGRFGAALIFIRWSSAQEPEGHLETELLSFDTDPQRAEAAVGRLSLHDVKRHLDRMIAAEVRQEPS